MNELAIGFIVAFSIGITGVGAGTITAPVFIFFLGLDPVVAIGTSLVFAVIVKIPAAISYASKKNVDYKILKDMLIGGIPGALAGSLILWKFSKSEFFTSHLSMGIGALILVTSILNLLFLFRKLKEREAKHSKMIPIASFFIGLEVGFSSVGAGALGTLLLLNTTALPLTRVVGTHIVFGLVLATLSGAMHLGMGNVDFDLLMKVSVSGIIGSMMGAYFISYVPAKPMKLALLIWLLFIGSQLVFNNLV